ncbi:hypothetical protein AB840_03210 [Megasphaera cerevisiae DSM 20462]|jgi:YhcH/YjgK/YiaL family protein|uniref:YhcH/YjgK/YiaL family protein n=1 Tax=Megasphaera cerevisiae DSM 20462 TaxID=1122219 RepID=A0A0J6WZT5_9FIRM|nr:YhcH/YjgK/YiaL family protein [Megasphaera cerevisiae]KMO87407.1 hypothetical protein AB840_03210 [Megasphaera cerevisiae DSM 20462]MCI1749863.1 YhcH/YjgK/YiaL family protein [Megasphaera cerevisiae]OKY54793.1 hypothetical protein BSR42_00330 [Megasphaera cerevisiae]SJZ38319.1 YhcH/YjgK/YiaL family protein [Megasphaera cerevisiae DSM 20462]
MYVGNIKQWKLELPFVPPITAEWIRKLASFKLEELPPGRHELGGPHFMNVDVTETAPAAQRNMEAHRQYIDIQMVIRGEECIGYQPVFEAGAVITSCPQNDAWFYNPRASLDTIIRMTPGTFAIFTPADGHRCLCAPDGTGGAIRKVIMKIHI